MTIQPTPVAVHPDQVIPTGVPRDIPAAGFVDLMERNGADPALLDTLADW